MYLISISIFFPFPTMHCGRAHMVRRSPDQGSVGSNGIHSFWQNSGFSLVFLMRGMVKGTKGDEETLSFLSDIKNISF